VFVVTGATGVIGHAITRALVGCGARVAVLARHKERAAGLLEQLGENRSRVLVAQGDVLDRTALERAAREIASTFGAVTGLVNAAGGNMPRATTADDRSFFDLPVEALRDVTELNLLGTVLPCQVFARAMAERGHGVILNVSSAAAVRPLTRVVGYAAAKAAVDNFTRWLAVHLAQTYSPRLRVNAIAPGFLLTAQNRYLLLDEATGGTTSRGDAILAHTPMRRFGTPDDLLGTVLWLLSPASAFVTGVVVPVDGGFLAFSGV
jgi:NAD(P)-dependent dehydrogenase (short-subunit alcohol dehydrogenase family)